MSTTEAGRSSAPHAIARENLCRLLRRQASVHPARVALCFSRDGESFAEEVTYGDLDRRARAIAARLQAAVAPASRVALLCGTGPAFIEGFFGCLYAGVVAVPAAPARSPADRQRVRGLLHDAAASFILTGEDTDPPIGTEVPGLSIRDIADDEALAWMERPIDPDAPAYLQYTSGSTGRPRGVVVRHANVLHNLGIIDATFRHSPDSVAVTWLPHFHDMGLVYGLLQPIHGGFRCLVMPPAAFMRKPVRWLRAIAAHRATHTGGPDFAYRHCLERIAASEIANLDLSSWRVAFNGAEPVRASTLRAFAARFAPNGFDERAFCPAYGLAEATLKVTSAAPADPVRIIAIDPAALRDDQAVPCDGPQARSLVSCGTPAHDTDIRIIDPRTRRARDAGRVGEIWVRGPGVSGEYWRQPEQSADTFQAFIEPTGDGPFLRTGDLGFLERGELFVTGRVKDVLIVRGHKYYPHDIENAIADSDAASHVNRVTAFGLPHEHGDGDEIVVACEVDAAPGDPRASAGVIRGIVSTAVGVHVQTVVWLEKGQTPRTTSGKPERSALRDRYLADELRTLGRDRAEGAVAMTNAEAAPVIASDDPVPEPLSEPLPELLLGELRQLIANGLGVDAAAIPGREPLSQLGLDSLRAVEIRNALQRCYGVAIDEIRIPDMTLAELARHVRDDGHTTPPPAAATAGTDPVLMPASLQQQALWFLQTLQPESNAFNCLAGARLRGALDVRALGAALAGTWARHPQLQSTFTEVDGVCMRRATAGVLAFEHHVLPARAGDEAARPLLDRLLCGRFDLERGPLFRAAVVTVSPGEHLLALAAHHIIVDYASLEILLREWERCYSSGANHATGPMPLDESPAQEGTYDAFARWQSEHQASPAAETSCEFWRAQMADDPPLWDRSPQRPSGMPAAATACGRVTRVVDGAIVERLRGVARAASATPYSVLLASLGVVLHACTGARRMSIGVPLHGRTRPEDADVIGFFVNAVPLRIDVRPSGTFLDLLASVRGSLRAALAHQAVPFAHAIERINPRREGRGPAPWQVLLAHRGDSGRGQAASVFTFGETGRQGTFGPHEITSIDLPAIAPQCELLIETTEEARGGMRVRVDYDRSCVGEDMVSRLLDGWLTVLDRVSHAPTLGIRSIDPLSAPDARALIEWGTGATVQEDRITDVVAAFEAQVRATPAAVAVVADDGVWTYEAFNARVNQLARVLRAVGVRREVRVAVCLPRSASFVIALWSVWKAGGVYVPIDPTYPAARVGYVLRDADVHVVMTDAAGAAMIAAAGDAANVAPLVVRVDEERAEPTDDLGLAIAPAQAAYVIYTSGSTGQPKGAVNTHAGLRNRLAWMQAAYPLSGVDAVLHKTPCSFDVSMWELVWPLMFGARQVVCRPEGHRDPAYLIDLMQRQAVTTVHFVPSMLELFLQAPGVERCATLRQVICSGEALWPAVVADCQARLPGAALHNLYGPTEASIDVTHWTCPSQWDGSQVPIGRPIANTQTYVLDASGTLAPRGAAGELYLGGINLARGYLHRPGLTAARFVPDAYGGEPGARLYRTGDRVQWNAAGELEYLGRLDHQIKLRGHRIELGEIEVALTMLDDVRQSVVVLREDVPGTPQLVAYVVRGRDASGAGAEATADATPDATPDASASDAWTKTLRARLAMRLPDYMVPAVIVTLDALPLSPNGKVDRAALPAPAWQPSRDRAPAVPLTPTEEAVRAIWTTLLPPGSAIEAETHFFERGGHSLLAMRMVARVRQSLNVDVPLATVFESPALRDLAARVDALRPSDHANTRPALRIGARPARIPLSFAQRRLWFIAQLERQSPAYNCPAVLTLDGPVSVGNLRQALTSLVARHESLRTIFPAEAGEPRQEIQAPAAVPVPLIDLSALPESTRAICAHRLAGAEARRPFDLATGPLLRVALLRLASGTHHCLITLHHIICDGWSLRIFLRELSAASLAIAAGERVRWPVMAVQYADVTCWQHEWLTDERLDEQRQYWRRQLTDLSALELPGRRRGSSHRVQRIAQTVDGPLLARLRDISRREGLTVFTTLLAAWQIVLGRWTGQRDIAVAVPVANRTHPDMDAVVGFFVNTLILRAGVSSHATCRAILMQVRDALREAYRHQDLPFDQVVDELRRARAAEETTHLRAMFTYDAALAAADPLGSARITSLTTSLTAPKCDLHLGLEDSGDALALTLEYAAGLFEPEQMVRLVDRYHRALELMADRLDARAGELSVLDGAEYERVVETWNATARTWEGPSDVVTAFEAQVRRTPDAVAVVADDGVWTYEAFNARANQLARRLRATGVRREVRVAVCLPRSAAFIIGLWSVWKAGGVYVPVDPSYPAARLGYLLRDADVRVVLTDAAGAAAIAAALREPGASPLAISSGDAADAAPLVVRVDEERCEATDDLGLAIVPAQAAYVIYTSGSTGQPKGAVNTHAALWNLMAAMQAAYPLSAADAVLHKTPSSFDVSLLELAPPLLAGARQIVCRPDGHRDPAYLIEVIRQHAVTTVNFVPSMLEVFLQEPGVERCTTVRQLFSCGEALWPAVVTECQARLPGAALHNLYGPVEAAVQMATWTCPAAWSGAQVPIGRPIANARTYVFDAGGAVTPCGVAGELYLGGIDLARGYLNRPGLTASRFVPDAYSGERGARLYRTGDRARWNAAGELEYLGRTDHQIKLRGQRIELGEIEAALSALPGVRQSVVLLREDVPGIPQLVAYVVSEAPAVDDWRAALAARLPAYMMPAAIVPMTALPVNANGKVDRRALPAPVVETAEDRYLAPRTPLETWLAELWAGLLGRERVSVDDNFFALGGHSLLVTRVMARIRQAFDLDVPIITMFEHPTVADLALAVLDRQLAALDEAQFAALVSDAPARS